MMVKDAPEYYQLLLRILFSQRPRIDFSIVSLSSVFF